MDSNEKYQELFKEKQRIDKELNDLLSHSVVCIRCGYCKDYKDIDLDCLRVESWYGYWNSGTDFYYDCNECDKKVYTELTKEQFEKILDLHGITWAEWVKKYPKNYTNKSI